MSTSQPQSVRPRIASGERYCRVWISSVKCRFDGVALPRSAILIVSGCHMCGGDGGRSGSDVGAEEAEDEEAGEEEEEGSEEDEEGEGGEDGEW